MVAAVFHSAYDILFAKKLYNFIPIFVQHEVPNRYVFIFNISILITLINYHSLTVNCRIRGYF